MSATVRPYDHGQNGAGVPEADIIYRSRARWVERARIAEAKVAAIEALAEYWESHDLDQNMSSPLTFWDASIAVRKGLMVQAIIDRPAWSPFAADLDGDE